MEQEVGLAQAVEYLKDRGIGGADIGLVLGSGLGHFASTLDSTTAIPYREIPNMPEVSVVGHDGELVQGQIGRVRVLCLKGRVHLYEGHSIQRVVFGVRLLAKLGIRAALLTNAAGGINPGFVPGDLMLVRDHLNLLGQNPLCGPNNSAYGPRFPDLSQAYDPRVCEAGLRAALDERIELQQGIYAAMLGPSYETPAEIRMLKTLGADAVGMSTVPEVIALNHMGVRVGAMSCITNFAAGLGDQALSHDDVEQVARASSQSFQRILRRWIERAGEAYGS